MKERLIRSIRATLRHTASIVAICAVILAFVAGWLVAPGQPAEPAIAAGGATSMYTCSMHPQVRLPDPDAKCPICHMDLIPVAAGNGGDDDRTLTMSASAVRLAEIQTAPVERWFPTREVRMFGRVDFDETRISTIAAYFPGRLERLFVDYTGVVVKESDHLAEIYSPELLAVHEELRQALASVEAMRNGSESLRGATAATLDAAREKLRLWGLTETQIADLEQLENPIERLTIYSPIGGVVIHKDAVEGKYVKTGDPIYQVADLSRLWVRLDAYESQLPWIRFGQDVEFTIASSPGEVFHGRISFIDPVVDPQTRTVRVRLNVDNADSRLKPGMFVRAIARSKVAGDHRVIDRSLAGKWISPMHPEIIKDGPGSCDICGMPLVPVEEMGYFVGDDVEPPLVIPASAALITGRRAVVYVKVPGEVIPSYEGREVDLGPRAGDYYIVEAGLRQGEDVVVNGAFKIDSALQIMARPSMMSPGAETESGPPRLDAPEGFLLSLDRVFAAYFAAQEALAADDAGRFERAATDLASAIGFVETAGLHGEPLGQWRRIAGRLEPPHPGEGIDSMRRHFDTWSGAIIDLERRFGHLGVATHYVTFCPMAFENRGAHWLARSPQVTNPYFGASMLRCGTVQATSPPRDAEEDAP